MPSEDVFSNPMAPPDAPVDVSVRPPSSSSSSRAAALRNDDFRKLLTTPRSAGSTSAGGVFGKRTSSSDERHSFTHRTAPTTGAGGEGGSSANKGPQKGAKKKGGFGKGGHKKKNDEDEDGSSLNDILKQYRDRAAERRDGENKESSMPSEAEMLQMGGAYRAVPGDARAAFDAAERRKQAIQESKYLGGDMEHTHLVKGLDYSLLSKVRSEIETKQLEDVNLESAYQSAQEERDSIEATAKSSLAKSVYRILFKEEPVRLNDLFAPRRMAYVVELDDEFAESDIPTTLLRSKQECPVDQSNANLSTNDMVIQKLTQVLSYLRQDTKRKRKEKLGVGPEMDLEDRQKMASRDIYDDVGTYVPSLSKRDNQHHQSSRGGGKDDTYFDRPSHSSRHRDRDGESTRDRRTGRERERSRERGGTGREDRGAGARTAKPANEREAKLAEGYSPADLAFKQQTQQQPGVTAGGMGSALSRAETAEANAATATAATPATTARRKGDVMMSAADSYAECYPGGIEMYDAAGESDDEADYSKMDLGNKKGPVKRADFSNEEDYEQYLGQKEALPKAAYQFGVKMNAGRKTRKSQGAQSTSDAKKEQDKKIDKQWNDISKILQKRKDTGDHSDANAVLKRAKY